ncbi:hypothetical protein NW801_12705 [Brevibacillus laterosporus]|uniref:Uncharacterized protein n=2 Tax=Brevibacillus TaxID=55080 RepID=A0A0F7EG88_BRELA|nr:MULTISPECIES: hypothetical protein [Brevibacillus]AKF93565.1 hypothetical protein EX87_07885 [Brevibacillus laterosporus]MCR8985882.1 hypothetical protein [Brevibacillus laterosporus]MCZ0831615.1 hypothetical protein [Brevibacillus halotolerans]GIO03930.1 hypothetical protein J5TS2_45980 [Brevibacillus halotolerans]
MDLLRREPVEIWRLLIPRKQWLFAQDTDPSEFIFGYRDKVYVVNEDGSVISLPRPLHIERMSVVQLLDLMVMGSGTFDYDDNGIFDVGGVLKDMGYMAAIGSEKHDYQIEIVNTLDPDKMISSYVLKGVSFTFALYHAILRCHELNLKSDGLFEHEVKEIVKIEPRKYKPKRYLH